MAMSAYYLKGVAPKNLELWTIFKGCFPFVAIVILTLALTYIYPSLVTYLPDQFFGQAEEIPYDPNDESIVDPSIFKSL
jgi:TRAP-type mannitol/chloroaromatic compound transport system permease large subunit